MSAFSRCINYIITVLVASTNRNLFLSFLRNSHTLSDRVEVRQPHPDVNRMNTRPPLRRCSYRYMHRKRKEAIVNYGHCIWRQIHGECAGILSDLLDRSTLEAGYPSFHIRRTLAGHAFLIPFLRGVPLRSCCRWWRAGGAWFVSTPG